MRNNSKITDAPLVSLTSLLDTADLTSFYRSHMGWIWLDAYLAKKGSLFLELWTIIVDTLKWVDSKTKCFLASFS